MKATLLVIFGLFTISVFGQIKLTPHLLGIVVKNVDSSAKWYEEKLEFKVYEKMDFPEYDSLKIYFLKQGNFEIELIEKKTSFSIKNLRPDYDINKDPLRGISKITFLTENIAQVFTKVKQSGAKIAYELVNDKTRGVSFFIIEDPDGNMVQLIEKKKD